jgi:hypothetical protein
MPWMESSVTEERLRFVARVPHGEAMITMCAWISAYRARPAAVMLHTYMKTPS